MLGSGFRVSWVKTNEEEEEPREKKKAKVTCPTYVSFGRSRLVLSEKKENSPPQRMKKERRRRDGGQTGSRVGLGWKTTRPVPKNLL